ncbi:hypothetical protein CEXT_128781 [Caerostris extrusa]|uniref:Uncharacterized protein n=1 Tax=Caerostris extrusa TaxID=172846 RepID=A0AAV4RCF6_CAEEX|nr:hypothetical protein CEXT_128781 [Caerostris extrusa]
MVLALLGELVNCSEESQNSTETRRRAGRTDYPVYSPPDDYASKKKSPEYFAPDPVYKEDAVSNFQPGKEPKDQQDSKKAPPQFTPPPSDGYYYKPKPRYYSPKDIMYKSGTNVNWNVWKGDGPEGSDVKQPPQSPR